MFFNRKITDENLEKGEMLFFKHNGNFCQMIEMGDYSAYKKLKIPKQKEAEWYEVIANDLIDKINSEKTMTNLFCLVKQLVSIGKFEERVIQTIVNLIDGDYDTYTKLLFLEELKNLQRRTKDVRIVNFLKSTILKYKNMLLINNISVSDDWLHLGHLKDYDFSAESIKNRIMKL